MKPYITYLCRFRSFQKKLLVNLSCRYESILKNDMLIAASVLNPRQKLRVFQPEFAQGLSKPNQEEAVASVKRLLASLEEVRRKKLK